MTLKTPGPLEEKRLCELGSVDCALVRVAIAQAAHTVRASGDAYIARRPKLGQARSDRPVHGPGAEEGVRTLCLTKTLYCKQRGSGGKPEGSDRSKTPWMTASRAKTLANDWGIDLLTLWYNQTTSSVPVGSFWGRSWMASYRRQSMGSRLLSGN